MNKTHKLKCISWNVNGLRSCAAKGFMQVFEHLDADIFAVQETKMQEGQLALDMPGYAQYFNSAEKKGYSGTAVFTRITPSAVFMNYDALRLLDDKYEIPDGFENEGRIITLEFNSLYFVNVYTPNSQRGLLRLDYRMEWEDLFRDYICTLNKLKPVIICGDLNVAHNEIDIKNPKSNRHNAGFTDEERSKMTQLLNTGLIDSFRLLYPDKANAYTWWSYMGGARERNVGWRIDYFLTGASLGGKIVESAIFPDIMGSDHCPVMLEVSI